MWHCCKPALLVARSYLNIVSIGNIVVAFCINGPIFVEKLTYNHALNLNLYHPCDVIAQHGRNWYADVEYLVFFWNEHFLKHTVIFHYRLRKYRYSRTPLPCSIAITCAQELNCAYGFPFLIASHNKNAFVHAAFDSFSMHCVSLSQLVYLHILEFRTVWFSSS